MPAVAVRAGDVLTLTQRIVSDDVDADADGSERSATRTERAPDLLIGGRPVVTLEHTEQLGVGKPVIAADETEHERAVRLDDRHRFRRCGGVDPEKLCEGLDRRDSRRRNLLRSLLGRRENRGPGNASCDLQVCRVVAVLAGHERVLARSGRTEEVLALLSAHHPGLGLDLVELETQALEHAVVGLPMELEASCELVFVAIECVRVFHDELTHAQKPATGTWFVAFLDREVVEDLRELPVALDLAGVERHRLLMGHREDEPASGAVLEPEDLGGVAAGRLPELRRSQDRHEHLLAADRVHLLADDLLDLPVHSPPEREERPDSRADLADVPPADEQLVRDGLRVSGCLAQRGDEELGLAGDHEAQG